MSAVIALPLAVGEADARRTDLRHSFSEQEGVGRVLARALERGAADMVKALTAGMHLRDPGTAQHQDRVADITLGIGRVLEIPADRLRGLELAATIHDVGKLGVPLEILSKSGSLTPVEFELMKGHAEAGAKVLADIAFPWPLREIVWQHHERQDGSGYPRGLKNGQILLEARILAVADVVDAIASNRPYRPSLGITAALAEIEAGRGTRFDADVVDACLKLFRELGHRVPC